MMNMNSSTAIWKIFSGSVEGVVKLLKATLECNIVHNFHLLCKTFRITNDRVDLKFLSLYDAMVFDMVFDFSMVFDMFHAW